MGIPYEHGDEIDLRELEEVDLNNLNISGTLGVGETQDVGTAGAVLTSNGAGSSVTWNRPYFMKARVISHYNISSQTPAVLMTEDNLGGNNYNFGDFSVDSWTCPQTGIYRVSTCLTASSQTTDEIRQLVNLTRLYTNAGVYIKDINETMSLPGHDDESEFDEISVPANTIKHINIGEKVSLHPYYTIGAGSGITIRGGETATRASRTYMIIERII